MSDYVYLTWKLLTSSSRVSSGRKSPSSADLHSCLPDAATKRGKAFRQSSYPEIPLAWQCSSATTGSTPLAFCFAVEQFIRAVKRDFERQFHASSHKPKQNMLC